MNEPIEVIKIDDSRELRIYQDEDAQNPREDDNLGIMICLHSRYNLGDIGLQDLPHNIECIADLKKHIEEDYDAVELTELKLYDHSGITISASSSGQFADRWDSMVVGYIFTTRKKIIERFEVVKITKSVMKKVQNTFKMELEMYDSYLRGDIYYYQLVKKTVCDHCGETKEEIIDSCGGYYDINDIKKDNAVI